VTINLHYPAKISGTLYHFGPNWSRLCKMAGYPPDQNHIYPVHLYLKHAADLLAMVTV